MKKIFLVAIGIVCLMVSCTSDSTTELQTNPMVGQEVLFSPSNDMGFDTRTIYGEEANNAFPVYWVNGDKVLIYGKDCLNKQAEYAVSVDAVNQNYATSLDKTGDSGIQWGESASDFVAIYPSTNTSFKANGVPTATIRSTQNNVFEPVYADDNTTVVGWKGHAFASNASERTMVDGIMYARTEGATATDENGNAKQVDLHFKPFSTVLKFKFLGYDSNLTDPTVYVQSITVTSPDGSPIAGEFSLDITGSGTTASVTKASKGTNVSNSVTLNTLLQGGSYIPLKKGHTVEFDVFTLPLSDYTINENWTVTIVTAQHGTFTYKLKPTTGANTNLVAGKIHKITIPKLTINSAVTWDYSKWITQIPKPVYLSELSMPGTWYSAHKDYQNTTDLTVQYNAGIRAFNLDCRITYETEGGEDVLVDRGSIWTSDDDVYRPAEKYLVVAGTDGAGTAGLSYDKGDLVLDFLKTIATLIPDNEYVVVVLTIAEKPLTRDPAFGDIIVSGTVDPSEVIPAVATMLNENATALKLYTNKITKDTTVEDVLGKMIVKINTNNATISGHTYPTNSLVSFASMAMSGYISGAITDVLSSPYTNYYSTMQKAPMYWGNAATDLTYYYHQAQRTTTDDTTVSGVPTLAQREAAIDNIISQSTTIYDSSTHNGWFQLGIGGYTKNNNYADNSQTAVADRLNAYVQTKIETKMETDPSPVGIVLMNFATDADGNGIQLVKDIIEMNAKFYLKREGGDIITDGGSGDSSGTTGGDDMGDDQP